VDPFSLPAAIEVVARRYHTIDHTVEYFEGDLYIVNDYALYMTLYGCAFVYPTAWTSLPMATGATAGMPGVWTPDGSRAMDDFTQMNTITALPLTAWTTGQHVILGDGTKAYWSGSAWASGTAP
jgi:hypothetical protein